MSTLPDSVYDDAVRAYLRVPARHHISIGHLRATIDDPAAFRDALTVAYEAGAEDLPGELEQLREENAALRINREAHQELTDQFHANALKVLANLDATRNALADCVVKATEYGDQDDGFVAMYILPTGPIHRAIPMLEAVGISVRPGFDGRQHPDAITALARVAEARWVERQALGLIAEARASVALDGETVTLDEPQVTP